MSKPQTAERVSHTDASDNYVFQRSLLAYVYAAGRVSGKILEIGTGSGYGIEHVAPAAEHFLTIDKPELINKIPGIRTIDTGILEKSRIIEKITPLLIGLNIKYKSHYGGLRITGIPKLDE